MKKQNKKVSVQMYDTDNEKISGIFYFDTVKEAAQWIQEDALDWGRVQGDEAVQYRIVKHKTINEKEIKDIAVHVYSNFLQTLMDYVAEDREGIVNAYRENTGDKDTDEDDIIEAMMDAVHAIHIKQNIHIE